MICLLHRTLLILELSLCTLKAALTWKRNTRILLSFADIGLSTQITGFERTATGGLGSHVTKGSPCGNGSIAHSFFPIIISDLRFRFLLNHEFSTAGTGISNRQLYRDNR